MCVYAQYKTKYLVTHIYSLLTKEIVLHYFVTNSIKSQKPTKARFCYQVSFV